MSRLRSLLANASTLTVGFRLISSKIMVLLQKYAKHLTSFNNLITTKENRAVVRGGAGGALAPPELGFQKRGQKENWTVLLLAPPDLKT